LILASLTFESILFTIIALIILWIIVSIPVWLAAKALTGGRASFGGALLATLAGPIVFFVVTWLVSFALGAVIGATAYIFAYLLALLAWIGVYKVSFGTGWLRAIAIAILAWVLFILLSLLFGFLFGIAYPSPFFPTF
jgi:hypothetical protein